MARAQGAGASLHETPLSMMAPAQHADPPPGRASQPVPPQLPHVVGQHAVPAPFRMPELHSGSGVGAGGSIGGSVVGTGGAPAPEVGTGGVVTPPVPDAPVEAPPLPVAVGAGGGVAPPVPVETGAAPPLPVAPGAGGGVTLPGSWVPVGVGVAGAPPSAPSGPAA